MRKPLRNIGASVRARLLNLAKERNQPFDLLLTRYVLERLLYRLSLSQQRERFVLKGAMLLTTWFDNPLRPTRDLDLLGFGDAKPDNIIAAFKEICAIDAKDAVTFDLDSITVDNIREDQEYGGVRMKMFANIDGARVRVVVDVGFGDAVEPGLTDAEIPVLLDFPAPKLRAYARETVIAEKFQAMVALGRANTRMKDFYDVFVLLQSYEFNGDALARAIAATFERRKTEIPSELPDALTSAFAEDKAKQEQWAAFLKDVEVDPGPLSDVIDTIAKKLMPHVDAAQTLRGKGGA